MNLNPTAQGIKSAPRIAYSYIRFSSEVQAQGDSLRRQTKIASEVSDEHNWNLSEVRFQDLGVSGWTGANNEGDSGLAQFMAACEESKIPKNSVLIVENLDRLSRQKMNKALTQFMSLLEYVDIYCNADRTLYREGMDTMDYMRAIFEMSRANRESEHKSERLKAVWEAKRSNPEIAVKTNACPFWLEVSENKLNYEPTSHAITVQKIFDLREKGVGNVRIAKILNGEGVKPPKAAQWSYVTISKVLRDRKVLGEYRPSTVVKRKRTETGQVFKDYYPQVISESQFNRVQVMINASAKNVKTGAGSTRTNRNILKDAGRCAKCGSKVITEIKRGCVYVRCKHSKVSSECDSGSMRLDLFYDLLNTYFSNHISLNSWVSAVDTSDLDKQKVENDLAITTREKELKALFSAQGLNDLVIKTIIDNDEELKGLHEEANRISNILLTANTDDFNKVESLEVLLNLLGLACSETHEPENIQARLKVKSILDSFHGIRIYYKDYTAHVEINDIEFAQTYFKSLRGASSVKNKENLWEFQEYKVLEL